VAQGRARGSALRLTGKKGVAPFVCVSCCFALLLLLLCLLLALAWEKTPNLTPLKPCVAAACFCRLLQATGLALPGSDLDVVLLRVPGCPQPRQTDKGFG
jgi:hypothetical protein